MENKLPDRQSHRLRGYDYSAPGSYFLTVCTKDRRYRFGDVVDGEMVCSPQGEIAAREWDVSIGMRRELLAHAFIVMPNHVHGLVSIIDGPDAIQFEPTRLERRMRPRSIGSLVNGYTGAVTTIIKNVLGDSTIEVWQGNYHDHIVRDEREFDTIYAYILDNPARWEEDRFNLKNL
jgi:REP element-mobilizing transposase RayT